jgi:hypothetical protein
MASSKRLDACTIALLQGPVLNTRVKGFTCHTYQGKPVTASGFTFPVKEPPDT